MIINSNNISQLIDSWFSKSIFKTIESDFDNTINYEEVLSIFKFDYNRYFPLEKNIQLDKLLTRPEIIGILLYRIARQFYLKGNESNANIHSNLATFLTGFEIYYTSDIDKGIKFNHGIGTVIGARTKIGKNAIIHHNVTLGDKDGGRPNLLDNVIVFPGAKIIGNITIGNNCVIGANCVCTINVPDNHIAVGIPARIIKKNKK